VKNKESKVYGLVCILFTIMEGTIKSLMKEKAFLRLSKNKMSELLIEFLIFNLHQLSRTLYAWFGEKERSELIDAVTIELLYDLKQKNKVELEERYVNLNIDSFGDYLEEFSFKSILGDFFNIYNKREIEYADYLDNPEKGKGFAGTLLWEFGNKIAKIIERENDLEIIMKVQILGTSWTYFGDIMKKLLLEKEEK
jgi:hypothetical protein